MFCLDHEGVLGTLRTRQQRVRSVVIDKALGLRIPVKMPVRVHSDLMDEAGRACTMSHLNRRNGGLPRSNTIQPISMLVFALVEIDLVRAYHGLQQPRIARIQS